MRSVLTLLLGIGLTLTQLSQLRAQSASPVDSHYANLAALPFEGGYPTQQGIQTLHDELIFERGVQSYIWALPALNIYAMKEASEQKFGAGYNVLPIWKERLNAKTLVTTP